MNSPSSARLPLNFYNLSALCERLEGAPEYRPLLAQTRRYRDVMSALNDLRDCGQTLDVLERHDPLRVTDQAEQHAHQIISGALLWRAVVLYSRATKTSSKHRGAVSIPGKMPAELQAVHATIVGLRDNAIAHYGPGPSGSGPVWVRESAALVVDAADKLYAQLLYSRVEVQTHLIPGLRRVLVYITPRFWSIAEARVKILLNEVKRLYASDSEFAQRLRASPLDLGSFFDGDAGAVQQATHALLNPESFQVPTQHRSTFDLA